MEKRNTEIRVVKVGNPEEIVVLRASSLQDEIRFYLNDTQYLTAIEKEGGEVLLDLGEKVELKEVEQEEENQESILTIIKENLQEFFKLIFIMALYLVGLIAVFLVMSSFIDNIFIRLSAMDVILSILQIIDIVILESKRISSVPTIKSKHSAEHMIVNFLEKNKRLPKNMQEVKKSSRFTRKCSSRKLIKGIAEKIISKILASIMAVVADILYLVFFENIIGEIIVFLGVYYLTRILVGRLLKKYEKMKFIIDPIEGVLTNIVQCANTTKNVEDKDIILAYYVAREWMQIVYPEFYKEDEDVFMNNYSS